MTQPRRSVVSRLGPILLSISVFAVVAAVLVTTRTVPASQAETRPSARISPTGPQSVLGPPGGGTARFMQLNLCGGCPEFDPDEQVAEVVGLVTTRHVDVIGLNEVCREQAEQVADELGEEQGGPPFTWRMFTEYEPPALPGCSAVGDVVMTGLGARPVPPVTFTAQVAGAPESKGMVCLDVDLATTTRACSTHLVYQPDDAEPDVQAQQIDEVAQRLSRWTMPLVVMGDFNAAPNDPDMGPMYDGNLYTGNTSGEFFEIDSRLASDGSGLQCRCGGDTSIGGADYKNDYVFARIDAFTRIRSSRAKPSSSDHLALFGTLQLNRG